MRELIFASQNKHKAEEVADILKTTRIISLADLNFRNELPETHETLSENALEKAVFVYERFSKDCFADDTGLEVEALNGEPGVYSARYAGVGKSASDNINLLLERMKNVVNRKAKFRTVVALIENGKSLLFEGSVEGIILSEPRGLAGFGYDPIFQPEGFNISFAEMNLSDKNKISHRARAFGKLAKYLSLT